MSRFEEVIKEIETNNDNIIEMAKTGATMDQIAISSIAIQLELMNKTLAKLVDAIRVDKYNYDYDKIAEEDKEDVDQA